jgi:hypothetical protein
VCAHTAMLLLPLPAGDPDWKLLDIDDVLFGGQGE